MLEHVDRRRLALQLRHVDRRQDDGFCLNRLDRRTRRSAATTARRRRGSRPGPCESRGASASLLRRSSTGALGSPRAAPRSAARRAAVERPSPAFDSSTQSRSRRTTRGSQPPSSTQIVAAPARRPRARAPSRCSRASGSARAPSSLRRPHRLLDRVRVRPSFLSQLCLQPQPCVADASAKRCAGDVQRGGDFVLRQIARRRQQQRVAQFRRQPANLLLHRS